MTVLHRKLSLEQFLKLPEEKPALEFEEGVVTQKVSPKGQHSRLQVRLTDMVNRAVEPAKLALAFVELRTTFGGRSYVPDVAVYRWDRIPVDDAGQVANDFLEPPDLAVEIVSPEQSVNALIRKCLWYVANGVHVALLVDPADASVLVFRPDSVPVARRGPDGVDLGDVLPGFELTIQDLFDSLRLR